MTRWLLDSVVLPLTISAVFLSPLCLGYWMGQTAERWSPTPRGREVVCAGAVVVQGGEQGRQVARCAQEGGR